MTPMIPNINLKSVQFLEIILIILILTEYHFIMITDKSFILINIK